MELSSLTILITGGASGIGRCLVESFSPEVARVVVIDIDEKGCREVETAGANVKAYACDVSREEDVEAAVARIVEDGFAIDVLVNNAGIIHSAPLINLASRDERKHSGEAWRRTLGVNLDAVFYMTREVVDGMVAGRRKGVVINMSSISANGNPGQCAYAASKAGVNALTKSLAKELAPFGIRFAAIAPGFLDTPSTRAALSEAIISRLEKQIPLRRLGEPKNISQAVRFIIENDYLTGTIIEVDGGLVV